MRYADRNFFGIFHDTGNIDAPSAASLYFVEQGNYLICGKIDVCFIERI
jgi:hypothetical protein